MNKNIIIVGSGPNLSLGIAGKFAENNFSTGFISSNEEKLKAQVSDSNNKGIEANMLLLTLIKRWRLSKLLSADAECAYSVIQCRCNEIQKYRR